MIRSTDIPRSFDSKLERDFWLWLAAEREAGRIKAFWYHDMTLVVGGRFDEPRSKPARWTPDFMAQTNEDELVIYETKGFMRQHARDRILSAARQYPFRFVRVTRDKTGWQFVEVTP